MASSSSSAGSHGTAVQLISPFYCFSCLFLPIKICLLFLTCGLVAELFLFPACGRVVNHLFFLFFKLNFLF